MKRAVLRALQRLRPGAFPACPECGQRALYLLLGAKTCAACGWREAVG